MRESWLKGRDACRYMPSIDEGSAVQRSNTHTTHSQAAPLSEPAWPGLACNKRSAADTCTVHLRPAQVSSSGLYCMYFRITIVSASAPGGGHPQVLAAPLTLFLLPKQFQVFLYQQQPCRSKLVGRYKTFTSHHFPKNTLAVSPIPNQ